MPEPLYFITEPTRKAIVDLIQQTVSGPDVTKRPGGITIGRAPTRETVPVPPDATAAGVWVKITGNFNASTGYPWTQQKFDGTNALTDDTPTGNYLFDVAGNKSRKSGDKVQMISAGADGSGNAVYFIISNIPEELFRVNLSQNGGSAGSKSAYCTYTYDVTTLGGFALGTAMTVDKPREIKAAVVTAATKGLGYFDSTGAFVLAEAWEQYATGTC